MTLGISDRTVLFQIWLWSFGVLSFHQSLPVISNSGGFTAWSSESSGKRQSSNKDYLNGKEEILFSPSEYQNLGQLLGRELFKDGETRPWNFIPC